MVHYSPDKVLESQIEGQVAENAINTLCAVSYFSPSKDRIRFKYNYKQV